MKHLDSRLDYVSDEAFANFRPLIIGNVESSKFYRSASAIKNRYGRAETVRKIMRECRIPTVLDLTTLECPCMSQEFGAGLVSKIRTMLRYKGPYIVQCDSGKKRTGFVCMILEALSGTSYGNIVKDYLISYQNNGLMLGRDDAKLCEIEQTVVRPRLVFIAAGNEAALKSSIDLQNAASSYLKSHGLLDYELRKLQSLFLT